MTRADEQAAMNSDWEGVGIAHQFAARQKLSGLLAVVAAGAAGGALIGFGARALARGGAPPQARRLALIALLTGCAKFLAKNAAKVRSSAQRGGVAAATDGESSGHSAAGGGDWPAVCAPTTAACRAIVE